MVLLYTFHRCFGFRPPFSHTKCFFLVVLNVYCPECPPGGTIVYPGGQQKKVLQFGHGRNLVAFNGTSL